MENEIRNYANGDESQSNNEQKSPRKSILFVVKSNLNGNASCISGCTENVNASKLNVNAPTFKTNSQTTLNSYDCSHANQSVISINSFPPDLVKLNVDAPIFKTNSQTTLNSFDCSHANQSEVTSINSLPRDLVKLNVNAPTFKTDSQTTLNSYGCSHAKQFVTSTNSFPSELVMSCNPRIWRNISCRNLQSSLGCHNDNLLQPPLQRQRSENIILQRPYRPNVLPNGIISIQLRDGIKLDMTLDKAVRLTNNFKGIDVSISSSGLVSGVTHPNGKVNQYGSNVEIMTYDGTHKNDFVRFAKLWKLGISFTSSNSALVYRIDSGGVRSTGDTITDLATEPRTEHTISIFLCGSKHGERYFHEAVNVANQSNYQRTTDTDEFFINGFRITQKPYGIVKIYRLDNHCLIGMNSENSSITLTTSDVHCTAALHDTPHLFVKRGTQRVHFDGSCFIVRLDGSSAGFDDNNRLKVY